LMQKEVTDVIGNLPLDKNSIIVYPQL